MRSSRTSGIPTSGPNPCTAEYSPAGRPASLSSFPNATAVYGVSSCDFATTALPHNSAGNTFQATPASGLLNGITAPHTPIGARTVRTERFGIGLGIVLPYDRLPSLSMKTARSADDETSATAFFQGLPVSAW